MFNSLMIVLVLAVLALFIGTVGALYIRSERKREERMLMEREKDAAENPNPELTKMAMHTRYNGLSTRGRIN